MPLESMAIRRTIAMEAPEPSMCSRVPLASGLSKPISSPQTLGDCSGMVLLWSATRSRWELHLRRAMRRA